MRFVNGLAGRGLGTGIDEPAPAATFFEEVHLSTETSPLTDSRWRWLRAATVWPPLYVLFFFVLWLATAVGMMAMAGVGALGQQAPELASVILAGFMLVYTVGFAIVGLLHLFTMVLMIALMGVYVWLVLQADLDSNERLLWGLLVVFTGFIGQLLFLYRVLRPPSVEPDEQARSAG